MTSNNLGSHFTIGWITPILQTSEQEPPQSTPVSSPFFKLSKQVDGLYQNFENIEKETTDNNNIIAPK